MDLTFEISVDPTITFSVENPAPPARVSSPIFTIARTKCSLEFYSNAVGDAMFLQLWVRQQPPTKFYITTFVVEDYGSPQTTTIENFGCRVLWQQVFLEGEEQERKPKLSFRLFVQSPEQISSVENVPTSANCLESHFRDNRHMMEDTSDHDIRLLCDGEVVTAHRYVLSSRSPVFKAMFRSHMEEDRTGLINVPDVDPEVLRLLIRYFYTSNLPVLPFDLAIQLYEAADKYAVDALKKKCSEYLIFHARIDNACEILVQADFRNDQDLKARVLEYIHRYSVQVTWRGWQDFLHSHTNLALEVIRYSEIRNRFPVRAINALQ